MKGLSEFIKLLMSVVIVGACYQLKSSQQSETQLTTLGSPGLFPRTRDSSEGSVVPRSLWRPGVTQVSQSEVSIVRSDQSEVRDCVDLQTSRVLMRGPG